MKIGPLTAGRSDLRRYSFPDILMVVVFTSGTWLGLAQDEGWSTFSPSESLRW